MLTATAADYARIFEAERAKSYPVVDAFEQRAGYALPRTTLEAAARVLACPLKANPPNWQHGRVLYAAAKARIATLTDVPVVWCLDIGTAKGFSALCLVWALEDRSGLVSSVDVIDPLERERRNSVLEADGLKTLAEYLAPWPEAQRIHCEQSTGIDWLKRSDARVHVAFVDGKHDGDVVAKEGKLLAQRQQSGDLVMFDDVQISGVAKAVHSLNGWYELEYLAPKPERVYAIGVRR